MNSKCRRAFLMNWEYRQLR